MAVDVLSEHGIEEVILDRLIVIVSLAVGELVEEVHADGVGSLHLLLHVALEDGGTFQLLLQEVVLVVHVLDLQLDALVRQLKVLDGVLQVLLLEVGLLQLAHDHLDLAANIVRNDGLVLKNFLR